MEVSKRGSFIFRFVCLRRRHLKPWTDREEWAFITSVLCEIGLMSLPHYNFILRVFAKGAPTPPTDSFEGKQDFSLDRNLLSPSSKKNSSRSRFSAVNDPPVWLLPISFTSQLLSSSSSFIWALLSSSTCKAWPPSPLHPSHPLLSSWRLRCRGSGRHLYLYTKASRVWGWGGWEDWKIEGDQWEGSGYQERMRSGVFKGVNIWLDFAIFCRDSLASVNAHLFWSLTWRHFLISSSSSATSESEEPWYF